MISSISGSGYNTQSMDEMRQNRFKKIDQNGDGKITKEEMEASRPNDGKGPSVDEIFSKVDTDQDGVISDAEDQKAFEAMQKNGPPGEPPTASNLASEIFKKADSDGDGKITQTELSSLLKDEDAQSGVQELFKTADADEDGAISQSELEKTLKEMMENGTLNFPPPPPTEESKGTYQKSGATQDGYESGNFSVVA